MDSRTFIERALGPFENDESYSSWGGAEKAAFFWDFFTGENGWVPSVYAGARIDRMRDAQRHSIEHIIPKSILKAAIRPSRLKKGATTNPFNFAAADRNINQKRGHREFDFDEDEVRRWFSIPNLATLTANETGYDHEGEWIVPSRTRGDIARAVLYMSLVYDLKRWFPRDVTVLVSWAKSDPPAPWELAFNAWVETKIHRRNPLLGPNYDEVITTMLDDPELMRSICKTGTEHMYPTAAPPPPDGGPSPVVPPPPAPPPPAALRLLGAMPNGPGGQDEVEYVLLANTTDQIVSLDGVRIQTSGAHKLRGTIGPLEVRQVFLQATNARLRNRPQTVRLMRGQDELHRGEYPEPADGVFYPFG